MIKQKESVRGRLILMPDYTNMGQLHQALLKQWTNFRNNYDLSS